MDQFARGKLMLASFLTLVAAGAGFAARTNASGAWESQFGIRGDQFGLILGAGFLGFGVVIFFGGMLVEAIGYKRLLILAFVLHLFSAVMLFLADPVFQYLRDGDVENGTDTATRGVFWLLWASAVVFSVCQGLYEAIINPLIAQLYPENKTHYLNILHAGWPAGMIVGGLFGAAFMGGDPWIVNIPWEFALSVFVVFVLWYGVLALPQKFPSTASAMSNQGFAGTFACFASIPFFVLIIMHALIGYMELGVDSWITKLMENFLPNAIIVLVYTSALMFILRFFAGPIVHRINPIGLLLASSVIACLGLLWLGQDIESVAMVFVAATFYSLGKAFLWPTMLGVVGEQYPRSGAVAMGTIGAAGMLTVGLVAGPRIGAQQGEAMSSILQQSAPATFERYAADEPITSWGYTYRPVEAEKLGAVKTVDVEDGRVVGDLESIKRADLLSPEEESMMVENAQEDIPAVQAANLAGSRNALIRTARVPAILAIGFLGLLIYFWSKGGYKPVELGEPVREDELGPDEKTRRKYKDEDEDEAAPGMGKPAPSEY